MNCIQYCAKDGDFVHSPKMKPPRQLQLIEPRGWQTEVVRLAQAEPDDRTVHWFWEGKGGTGKTSLCKFLVVTFGAIILGGKAADIKMGILNYTQQNGHTPDLIVVNFTRSQEDYISYEGLESIKDMCFFSGKYEGGMVCGPSPQLICFANFTPDASKMSADRWNVVEIDE